MRNVGSRLIAALRRNSSTRLAAWIAILITIVVFGALFQPVVVQGKSMMPSLHDGQLLLMDRQHYRFHRVKPDDVVVFHHGRELYIKRVFATAGQTIAVIRSKDGITTLVETPVQRADALRILHRRPALGRLEAVRIPPQCVFVVGDNANYSLDSRDFGPVPNSSIVGYVPSPSTETFSTGDGRLPAVRVALR